MGPVTLPKLTLREALQADEFKFAHRFEVTLNNGNDRRVIVGNGKNLLQEALAGEPLGAALIDALDLPILYYHEGKHNERYVVRFGVDMKGREDKHDRQKHIEQGAAPI